MISKERGVGVGSNIQATCEYDDEEKKLFPLAVESIPSHPLIVNMPALVATHFAVVYPDAQVYVDKGVLPPMSIATQLYVDQEANARGESKGSRIKKQAQKRLN